MTPELRELFRRELLRQLAEAAPLALRLAALQLHASARGFTVPTSHLQAELDYLVQKGFAAVNDKAISPELPEYKATAAGRDEAARLGLA